MRIPLLERARREPLLQVAIDLTDVYQALELSIKIATAGAHIIEAGTPLIKSVGMHVVKLIRSIVPPDVYVVADTKIADAARYEVEIAASMGADAVTVLGVSEDDVISEACEVCKRLGLALMVDLIHVKNPIKRVGSLAKLGIEAVLVHVGVDVQRRRGISVKELMNEIREIASMGFLVAVAGGIKPEEAGAFVDAGARIVIIGSAIVKSTDPVNATRVALARIRGH